MEKHLVLFQVVSAGQNGPELGNDEEQIVYVLYTILNVDQNKVRHNSDFDNCTVMSGKCLNCH